MYGTIQASGNGKLKLNPGTYVVKTKLSVTGNAAIQGTGVTLYFACSAYPSPCGSSGASFELTGNGTLAVSPPTSGNFQGITIFYDRAVTTSSSLTGNSDGFGGTIYMKSAMLQLTGGGGTIDSVVIANTVKMSGNSTLRINAVAAENHPNCHRSRHDERDNDDDHDGRGNFHDWRGHHASLSTTHCEWQGAHGSGRGRITRVGR